MPSSVSISKRALRFLRELRDVKLYSRLSAAIFGLLEEPHPSGSKKLSNAENLYRVRVGDYRILYEVTDDSVIIHAIGHRRDIYS